MLRKAVLWSVAQLSSLQWEGDFEGTLGKGWGQQSISLQEGPSLGAQIVCEPGCMYTCVPACYPGKQVYVPHVCVRMRWDEAVPSLKQSSNCDGSIN